MEITVLSTRIADSTLQRLLPWLPLDQVLFPTGEVFTTIKRGSANVVARVTYLDSDMRVVRDRDDRVFVYTRLEE
jgi:hypothetical protein